MKQLLEKILAVVQGSGAELHPELRLIERGGAIHLCCECQLPGGEERQEPNLVRMPRELLIPVEGARWEERCDRLVLLQAPEGLGATQQELLELHIALYNAAGKLPWVNNHHEGAKFQWDRQEVSLAVRRVGRSGECFLRYGGRRDVLDLALDLGYLDRSTPFAHSAPLQVEVEGLRATPARPLDPPRVHFTQTGVRLSHLTCHNIAPQRLQVAIGLMVQGALRRSGGSGTPDADAEPRPC